MTIGTPYGKQKSWQGVVGKFPELASLAPATKHFFQCKSATHNDFTGSGKSLTGFATNTTTGAAANSVRMQSWYNNGDNGVISGGWEQPATKDFMILTCAQCVSGGAPSFYVGDGNAEHVRVQHYLAGQGSWIQTESVTDTEPVTGRNYVYAAVIRDGILEHYTTKSDGQTVYHANDVAISGSISLDAGFNCSHAKVKYDDTFPVETDQDYFGFLVNIFAESSPPSADIISGMERILEQWPLGNKALPSNWTMYL